jgi:Tfp pilus assembly protein PilV
MRLFWLIPAAMWNKRNLRFKMKNAKLGMMMIEVMLALTVVVLVLVALTAAATVALRNNKYAQNVVLANHYTQQGLEITRQKRDEAADWNSFIASYAGCKRLNSDLTWNNCPNPPACPNASASPNLGIFYRCLNITDTTDSVAVEVFVSWTESGRDHQAKAATILSKWQ